MKGWQREIVGFVAGVLCGVAGGWWLIPESAGSAEPAPVSVRRPRARMKPVMADDRELAGKVETESEKLLFQRVAELESEVTVAERAREDAAPLSYNEWFALQREANPGVYARLTNGVARSAIRSAVTGRMRAELLGTVDLSGCSEEEQACHAEYRAALNALSRLDCERLARRFLDPDFQPNDSEEDRERRRAAGSTAWDLAGRERMTLLREAGRLYGLDRAAAEELAGTMHLIVETTSSSKRFLKPQREQLTAE